MKHSLSGISDFPVQERLFDLENIVQQLKQGCDKKEFELQIKAYRELGNYYLHFKKDPINAVALYNFALAIVQDDQKNLSFAGRSINYQNDIIKQIKEAEKFFLFSITRKDITPSNYALDQAHQEYLKAIREEARAQLTRHQALTEIVTSQLPKGFFHEEVLEKEEISIQQIYQYISEQLRGFVRLMIKECQQVLKDANWEIQQPCETEYAIICFGSLARGEATPYSDLEFGVLLKAGKDTEENRHYFRVLTQFLNIKVINLGETTPRMQNIVELKKLGLLERFSEVPIRKGFSFDGQNEEGRKTPLGNKHFNDVPKERQYELIGSAIEMSDLCFSETERHIFSVLIEAELMLGNSELLSEYRNENFKRLTEIKEVYNTDISHIENYMKEKFSLRTKEDSSRVGLRKLLIMAFETLDNYFTKISGKREKNESYYEFKYDFYRFPFLMIRHLFFLFFSEEFNIKSTLKFSEILNYLEQLELINFDAKVQIFYILNKILFSRLSLYLHYNEQWDKMVLVEDMKKIILNQRIEPIVIFGINIQKEIFFLLKEIIIFHENVFYFLCEHLSFISNGEIKKSPKLTISRKYIPIVNEKILAELDSENKEIESRLDHLIEIGDNYLKAEINYLRGRMALTDKKSAAVFFKEALSKYEESKRSGLMKDRYLLLKKMVICNFLSFNPGNFSESKKDVSQETSEISDQYLKIAVEINYQYFNSIQNHFLFHILINSITFDMLDSPASVREISLVETAEALGRVLVLCYGKINKFSADFFINTGFFCFRRACGYETRLVEVCKNIDSIDPIYLRKALDCFDKAKEIGIKLFGTHGRIFIKLNYHFFRIFFVQGDSGKAREALNMSKTIMQDIYPETYKKQREWAMVCYLKGERSLTAGKTSKALNFFREAEKIGFESERYEKNNQLYLSELGYTIST